MDRNFRARDCNGSSTFSNGLCLQTINIHRIEAYVAPQNTASVRV